MRRYSFFRKIGCSALTSAILVVVNLLSDLDDDHAGFMKHVWDMREFEI